MFYEMELSQFAHNWLLRSFRFCFFGDIIVVRKELVLLIYGGYILNNVALHISFLRSCFEETRCSTLHRRLLSNLNSSWQPRRHFKEIPNQMNCNERRHHISFLSFSESVFVYLRLWNLRGLMTETYFALGQADVCAGRKSVLQTASEADVMFSRRGMGRGGALTVAWGRRRVGSGCTAQIFKHCTCLRINPFNLHLVQEDKLLYWAA